MRTVEPQDKASVFAMKAVETQGKGGVSTAKAVETQGRGGIFTAVDRKDRHQEEHVPAQTTEVIRAIFMLMQRILSQTEGDQGHDD